MDDDSLIPQQDDQPTGVDAKPLLEHDTLDTW